MSQREHIRLLQIQLGAILAQAVSTVAELGIADLIERGSTRPISELATAMGCHERSLYRCLRYLASHGIFEEKENRSFGLTPLAEALRSDAENSYRAGARMLGISLPVVGELEHCLRSGEPGFGKAYGKPVFDYLAEHEDEAVIFDAAMTSFHGPETPAMVETFDFSGVGTLADIGGGAGGLLTAILSKYPSMNGVLFDLDHVAGRARDNISTAGLDARCEVRLGNFFESFPSGADAYLMRHIIHDWTDEQCHQILRNCRAVIPNDGRLFVVEAVVLPDDEPSPAKDQDALMMLLTGGLERTEDEYRDMFAAAGFELTGVTPTPSPVSVIEGRPI